MSFLSSKTKYSNVKVFNIITKLNETAALVKHILCNCKWKFNSTTYNLNVIVNVSVSIIEHAKNIIVWISSTCIGKNGKSLKKYYHRINNVCDKIINVKNSVSGMSRVLCD